MLLGSRLPLSDLVEVCRVVRHSHGAGLTLKHVFDQLARSGPSNARPIAARIGAQLEAGESLEHALKDETGTFPPLFITLATVGERSGALPETFAELEKYFLMQQKLRREFIAHSTWPVVQFLAAVFVVAGLIFILGWIAEAAGPGTKPIDPLGLGLTGGRGALIFLVIVFGGIGALVGAYVFATRKMAHREAVDRWLLRIPVVGPTLVALALTRFCLALRLTMETGMSITKALRLSLRATGNAAYEAAAEPVHASLKAGGELTEALSSPVLFPEEFRHILAVGEESGRLTEVLRHQAEHYEETSRIRLAALTQVASWGVWLFTAILIIVAIIQIFNKVYLKALSGI